MIDWGFIEMVAKREAEAYANHYEKSSPEWFAAHNGYYQGRIHCAAERESLRSILERKDKEIEGIKLGLSMGAAINSKEKSDITDNSLDDLI